MNMNMASTSMGEYDECRWVSMVSIMSIVKNGMSMDEYG